MSDRVAYVAGNTRGRDHLTGITLLRTEIEQYVDAESLANADQIWPVDVTLTQAMAVAWRVKKWKLTGTCSVEETQTNAGFSPIHAVGSATIEADMPLLRADFNAATRETDIISVDIGAPFHALSNPGAQSVFGQPFCSWSTHRDGAGPITGSRNTSSTTGLVMATRKTLFNPDTSLFCPQFSGPGFLIGATPTGPEDFYAFATPQRTPTTHLIGTGTGNLLAPGTMNVKSKVAPDFTVPMQLSFRLTGQGVASGYTGAGSLVLTLEAMEFWSHDGTYDTTSGNPL